MNRSILGKVQTSQDSMIVSHQMSVVEPGPMPRREQKMSQNSYEMFMPQSQLWYVNNTN